MVRNTPITEAPTLSPDKKDLSQVLKNRQNPQTAVSVIDLAAKLGVFLPEVTKLEEVENLGDKLSIRGDDLYSLASKPDGEWVIVQNRKGSLREFEIPASGIYQESILVRDRLSDAGSSLPIAIKLIPGTTKYYVEGISDANKQIQIPYENVPEFMAELRKIAGKIAILCNSRIDQMSLATSIEKSCKIKSTSTYAIVNKSGLVNWMGSFFTEEKNQLHLGKIAKTIRGESGGALPNGEILNKGGTLTKSEATTRMVDMLQGAIHRQVNIVQAVK